MRPKELIKKLRDQPLKEAHLNPSLTPDVMMKHYDARMHRKNRFLDYQLRIIISTIMLIIIVCSYVFGVWKFYSGDPFSGAWLSSNGTVNAWIVIKHLTKYLWPIPRK